MWARHKQIFSANEERCYSAPTLSSDRTDSSLLEVVAGGESGLSGSDDDGVVSGWHGVVFGG